MAKMAPIPDDCERTATVALPTDCQTGVLVDNHSSFAALDGFSTVFEPPLYRSKNGHTHTHTKIRTRTTTLPRCATPTRGKKGQTDKLDGVPRTQTSRLLLCYYSSRSHGTVCTAIGKGRNYADLYHVTRLMAKMAAIPDDCERTATVALPTAASPGLVPTTTAPLPH